MVFRCGGPVGRSPRQEPATGTTESATIRVMPIVVPPHIKHLQWCLVMDRFVAAQMVTRKPTPINDREALAEVTHRKRCAKHKGRNHWRNWERRLMAKEKREAADKSHQIKMAKINRHVEQVRAYWMGLRDDLPGLTP